jgi:hypothetical protein
MPRSRSVTIQLTEKQRRALRSFTGQDHRKLTFETVHTVQAVPARAVASRKAEIPAPKLAGNHNATMR